MLELNISSPLSLTSFFLAQKIIYKSKMEIHNISLDIYVSDTSVVYPETFIYLGK